MKLTTSLITVSTGHESATIRDSKRGLSRGAGKPIRRAGFTLIEVMMACFVFFIVSFALLELVTQNVASAKVLSHRRASPGFMASVFVGTNSAPLEEGTYDFDLSPIFPGTSGSYTIEEYPLATNGLYLITFELLNEKGGQPERLTILKYSNGPGRGSRLGGGLR